MSEEEIVEVGDVTNNEKIDDYLNEMLTESQEPDLSTADEFEKNKEGVTGDEWEDEEFERLHKQIKEEQEAARREENKRTQNVASETRKRKKNLFKRLRMRKTLMLMTKKKLKNLKLMKI